jgi:hypothetical protein
MWQAPLTDASSTIPLDACNNGTAKKSAGKNHCNGPDEFLLHTLSA